MRLASRLSPLFALLAVALPVTAATPDAAPLDGEAAIALIAADHASGRIDTETRLLEEFRYVFAPERVDARYRPERRTLLRCFTPTVAEFHRRRAELSPAAVAEIDGYLEPPAGSLARATYISPAGLFVFSYTTSGANAVSAVDVAPANGIPDRVERCAEYADFSWNQEIDVIGFTAPTIGGAGYYEMSFESMGAYGYTTISGFTTRIVLHNTFAGFPPNDDPDGNPLGAAKVTVAHEFKHASQFTTSAWSEGGWVELDATWMEDIVYPATNDYHNYVNNSGPNILGQPWTSLDSGGSGSYEDCLWQHYLSNVFTNQIMVDFWDRRASFTTELVTKTYREVLALYSSDWDESYPGFAEWAWFTGSRSEPPFGFPDAPDLKRQNLRVASAISTYPWSRTDSVARIAEHPFRFDPGTQSARIVFDGSDAITNWTLSVIMEEPDGTFTIVRPALDAGNACDYTVPMTWSQLEYVGVIVTNSKRSGNAEPYTLDVTDEGGTTGVEVTTNGAPDRLVLQSTGPNPFRGATSIRWSAPREASGSVRVFDVTGRRVRTLVDGTIAAGAGEVAWDGLDESGRPVPAGIYWVRIDTLRESAGRKLTLLR